MTSLGRVERTPNSSGNCVSDQFNPAQTRSLDELSRDRFQLMKQSKQPGLMPSSMQRLWRWKISKIDEQIEQRRSSQPLHRSAQNSEVSSTPQSGTEAGSSLDGHSEIRMGLKEASSSTAIPTSLTEVISTEALSKLGIAGSSNEKKDGSEIIRQFETELEQWLNDETVTGEKEIAAKRIRKAFYDKEDELDLSGLKLSSLPPAIGSLNDLTALYLQNNELQSLPREIGRLVNLTRLQVSLNKLKWLPWEIGLLENLTVLHLWNNELQSLPWELGWLIRLTELSLNDNKLRSLPRELGRLFNLTALYLQNNKLESLPDELARSRLTDLDLSGNQLQLLPPWIRNVQMLDFYDNPLNN